MNTVSIIDQLTYRYYRRYRKTYSKAKLAELFGLGWETADYFENLYQQELAGELVFIHPGCTVPLDAIINH